MRSCRSPRSVAFLAISKPGSVKTRIFLSMICLRAQSGNCSQACFALLIGLPNQRAALGHAVERVGVGEGLGVAAENHGHVAQIAVDADAILGGDHEVRGRRALLLRAVLGIGADVDDFLGIAEASRSPSRSKIRSLRSPRIAPRFLPVVMAPQPPMEWKRTATAPSGSSDGSLVADDRVGMVDAEDEEVHAVGGALAVLAGAVGGGELVGADDVLGAEVARAEAVAAAVDLRDFGERDRGQPRRRPCTALENAVRMSRPSGLSPARLRRCAPG
jgi:hypothetical protein